MDANIEFFERDFLKARDAYASKILDSIVDEETFWKYYYKLHNVLPVGDWVSRCPKTIDEWTDDIFDHYQRTEVIHFDRILEDIEDYRGDEEYQKGYLTEKQREILKNNTTWDLMKEVLEYTKENQVCGFTWDW